MANTEWAVELRPKTLDQMVGQETNREIISEWIKNNNLPNSVIFYGKSGCGKTTASRIIPLLMNAELIELDAASHNSVEDARQLNEQASRMSLTGRHKVFLIDEAHMLSNGAWNALLKSIEEPNDKIHFIFATTEYTKMPMTIRGRSRMLKFYSVPDDQLKEYAQAVLEHKGYELKDEVINLIVRRANGQVRDLLKLLQTTCEGNLNDLTKLKKFLAIPDTKGMRTFINAVLANSPGSGIVILNSISTDLLEWVRALQAHIYELLEDKYRIREIVCDETTRKQVKTVQDKFTDRQFGALLTQLNKIQRTDEAYAQLFALLFNGVQ
ncbi:MAG: AAA family ATPase [Acetobacter sp.]|nr:AAA family ATPase [Acetobacter sp.]